MDGNGLFTKTIAYSNHLHGVRFLQQNLVLLFDSPLPGDIALTIKQRFTVNVIDLKARGFQDYNKEDGKVYALSLSNTVPEAVQQEIVAFINQLIDERASDGSH